MGSMVWTVSSSTVLPTSELNIRSEKLFNPEIFQCGNQSDRGWNLPGYSCQRPTRTWYPKQ